ncbi:MAG: hypothetical protein RBS80_25680 [Thermoguttaceae bacterium]|nr:hypothetical protein [Thermoguttaceae bacterium]
MQHCIAVPRGNEYNTGVARGNRWRMGWTHIVWDHTPGGNVVHIEEHDLTTDDVDYVLEHCETAGTSRVSGRPCVFGYTPDHRYIIVVFEEIQGHTAVPVTAYEVPEP